MIAKISRGASVRGLANYLHGPGKANEHVYEGVVGGRVIGGTLGAEGASDGSRWAVDMAAVMGQRPDVEKPVWHMSLRLPAKDRTLSDAQWRDVAQEMGERMGWGQQSVGDGASRRRPCAHRGVPGGLGWPVVAWP